LTSVRLGIERDGDAVTLHLRETVSARVRKPRHMTLTLSFSSFPALVERLLRVQYRDRGNTNTEITLDVELEGDLSS
jgi:hypothetical protein